MNFSDVENEKVYSIGWKLFHFPNIFGTVWTLWSRRQPGIQIKCIIWIRLQLQSMNISAVENENHYFVGWKFFHLPNIVGTVWRKDESFSTLQTIFGTVWRRGAELGIQIKCIIWIRPQKMTTKLGLLFLLMQNKKRGAWFNIWQIGSGKSRQRWNIRRSLCTSVRLL
jgi:hypothetical protein